MTLCLLIHSRHGDHSHRNVPCVHDDGHVRAGPPSCRSSSPWSCIRIPSCDRGVHGGQARHQLPSCHSSILWFCIHSLSCDHDGHDGQAQPLSFHRIQDRIHHIRSQVHIHHSHSHDHSQGHSHSSLRSRHQHQPQQQRWPRAR